MFELLASSVSFRCKESRSLLGPRLWRPPLWSHAFRNHSMVTLSMSGFVASRVNRLALTASVHSKCDLFYFFTGLCYGSTTIRLRTFRLRHFVYRHFVYRHFVYCCIPAYRTVIHPASVSSNHYFHQFQLLLTL